jgi:uncharacterized protein (TIGR02391 family)
VTRVEPLPDAVVEKIGEVLGHTANGFTGARSPSCWRPVDCPTRARSPSTTASPARCSPSSCVPRSGAPVVAFLNAAMAPARWAGEQEYFQAQRAALNEALAFAGLRVREDGKVAHRPAAATLSEAAQRTRRLRDALTARNGHAEVFRYCNAELLADDCFNAVFEAVKGLGQRIRDTSALDADGTKLVDLAFAGEQPVIAFNALRTETERNEQRGLANIMRGLFSAVRNPQAHSPSCCGTCPRTTHWTCSACCRCCTVGWTPPWCRHVSRPAPDPRSRANRWTGWSCRWYPCRRQPAGFHPAGRPGSPLVSTERGPRCVDTPSLTGARPARRPASCSAPVAAPFAAPGLSGLPARRCAQSHHRPTTAEPGGNGWVSRSMPGPDQMGHCAVHDVQDSAVAACRAPGRSPVAG